MTISMFKKHTLSHTHYNLSKTKGSTRVSTHEWMDKKIWYTCKRRKPTYYSALNDEQKHHHSFQLPKRYWIYLNELNNQRKIIAWCDFYWDLRDSCKPRVEWALLWVKDAEMERDCSQDINDSNYINVIDWMPENY